ncbi:MAG: AAA family ATPase, partial [Cyanobacteriota bacterium]|nr:AAA family ATPase [Cyanobacteriota bacterium]
MSDLFKGFEQLVELAKTLEEKLETGEIKADMQVRTRRVSSIPRTSNIPRSQSRVHVNTSTSRTQNPSNPTSSDLTQPSASVVTSLKEIGGLSEVLKELQELIAIPLKRPDLLDKIGLEPTRGVLLVGSPGTGKTLTARALAEELGVNYIAIVGPEILGKYYGEAEQKLRDLFEKAAKNAPCIIFIDEIDSLAP